MGVVLAATCSAVLAKSNAINQPIEGVGIDRTRIVMEDGTKTASFGVQNRMAAPVVVTAWVSDLNGKVSEDFVVSPSLYQLNDGKTGKGTVRLLSELPTDRESVYWLVVNTAKAGTAERNQLNVAIGQRIKVFYRPDGLKGDARYAAKHLIWTNDNGRIKVKNPTALSVSVSDINILDKTNKVAALLLPFSEVSLKLPIEANKTPSFSFTFFDEYGGLNEVSAKLIID